MGQITSRTRTWVIGCFRIRVEALTYKHTTCYACLIYNAKTGNVIVSIELDAMPEHVSLIGQSLRFFYCHKQPFRMKIM